MSIHRRQMLMESAIGFGSIAFTALMRDENKTKNNNESHPSMPHLRASAKSVIFLFMGGGPGQTDTFDPKPELKRLDGEFVPRSIASTVPNIPRSGVSSKLFGSPYTFQPYGESGIEVSSLYEQTACMADELCIVRSLNHRVPVHGPGECVALTGTSVGNRPSIGSWLGYGLGSENADLPGYLAFLSGPAMPPPQRPGWSAGFLPAQFQGTLIEGTDAIPFTDMPFRTNDDSRRSQIDFMNQMNRLHLDKVGFDSELEARLDSYELAFRMQTSAPEAFSMEGESEAILEMYGIGQTATHEFGSQCLMARRLVERGVRCIQLRNGGWDAHSNLTRNHDARALATDRPIAGLLRDLKQRGLLETTLVVWGGEFGRTPTTEGTRTGDARGRDHSPSGYTMWMAGGGIKGGQVIGATDEVGYVPIERPLSPADMHATILHAMGLDQYQLTFRHNNRNEIATVFGGEVIEEAFA